jgi:hypothetical protein
MSIDDQVDRLEGSPAAKARLRVILANLAGQISIIEACAELDVNESWYFDLKRDSLRRWLKTMEPGTPGRRPSTEKTADEQHIAELEAQVRKLELELKAAQLREELARQGLSRHKAQEQPTAKKANR